MASTDLDPTRCPICGDNNECGMAKGAETCWCFTATIAPEALERLPAEARGKVCVCPRCAGGASRPGAGAFPVVK